MMLPHSPPPQTLQRMSTTTVPATDAVLTIDGAGWLHPATHCPSDNFNARPAGLPIDVLVIHNISLPPGEFGGGFVQQLFTNTLDCDAHPDFADLRGLQVSAHLLIERDGAITQFVSFLQRAWHAGVSRFGARDNCNDFSIGIELEGTDDIAYAPLQYRQLAAVTQLLQSRFPAITPAQIVGHADIAPTRKTDPGPAFDWIYFRDLLAQSRR
jgi:AmpD protein